jgi:hypothetical protein
VRRGKWWKYRRWPRRWRLQYGKKRRQYLLLLLLLLRQQRRELTYLRHAGLKYLLSRPERMEKSWQSHLTHALRDAQLPPHAVIILLPTQDDSASIRIGCREWAQPPV